MNLTQEQAQALKTMVLEFAAESMASGDAFVEWERLALKTEELLGLKKRTANPLFDEYQGEVMIGIYAEQDDDEFEHQFFFHAMTGELIPTDE